MKHATRWARRRALTLLEVLVAASLLGLFTIVAWQGYIGGVKETSTSGDYLNAMQNAMVLMESIQEDVRQMAILNSVGAYLVPFTIRFSPSGKAMMFRKSSFTNTDGEMAGASFTIVCYQMVKHPDIPGVFTIRRIERTTDGKPIPGTNREEDDKVFKLLYLRDIRFDLMVMFGAMTNYRTFIRVSATATNAGAAAADPRVHMITNMFETISPEYIQNKPGQVGFARRFLLSPVRMSPGQEVLPGNGYTAPLPPSEWTDFQGLGLPDFLDTDGLMKNLPGAPTASSADPFDAGSFSAAPLRTTYIKTGMDYLRGVLGPTYRGRIPGQVVQRNPPAGQTPWVEAYTLDCASTTPVATQLNDVLTRVIARGPEAVEDLGHTFYSRTYANGVHPDGSISYMIKPEDADLIVQNR